MRGASRKKWEQMRLRLAYELRVARENTGMRQGEAAGRAGLSRTSLVNIEAGRQGCEVDTLVALAAVYLVRPGALLDRATKPHRKPRGAA